MAMSSPPPPDKTPPNSQSRTEDDLVAPRQDDDITWEELSYWLEFGCWTSLVLFPFLRWINGPSVSTDQLVVRTGLVIVAALGAIGLRTYKLLRARRGQANHPGPRGAR